MSKFWQFKELAPLPPVVSTILPWDRSEALRVLPPRNKVRYAARGQYQASTVEDRKALPRKLVDAVADGRGLSKGAARKAIAAGRAYVHGPRGDGPVYDPDYVLASDEWCEVAAEPSATAVLDALSDAELLQVAPIVDLLKTHDWTYDFSDDGSVWRRGQAQREAIIEALKALRSEVARALWAMYAPSGQVLYL